MLASKKDRVFSPATIGAYDVSSLEYACSVNRVLGSGVQDGTETSKGLISREVTDSVRWVLRGVKA